MLQGCFPRQPRLGCGIPGGGGCSEQSSRTGTRQPRPGQEEEEEEGGGRGVGDGRPQSPGRLEDPSGRLQRRPRRHLPPNTSGGKFEAPMDDNWFFPGSQAERAEGWAGSCTAAPSGLQ